MLIIILANKGRKDRQKMLYTGPIFVPLFFALKQCQLYQTQTDYISPIMVHYIAQEPENLRNPVSWDMSSWSDSERLTFPLGCKYHGKYYIGLEKIVPQEDKHSLGAKSVARGLGRNQENRKSFSFPEVSAHQLPTNGLSVLSLLGEFSGEGRWKPTGPGSQEGTQ